MTAAEVMSELTYQMPIFVSEQDVNVVLEREMLRPKLDRRTHDFVLRLEGRHEPPVERECPEHRADDGGRRDDKADEIEMAKTGEPARARRGEEVSAGLGRGAHLSPRARKS